MERGRTCCCIGLRRSPAELPVARSLRPARRIAISLRLLQYGTVCGLQPWSGTTDVHEQQHEEMDRKRVGA
jgi:hypothetical protein